MSALGRLDFRKAATPPPLNSRRTGPSAARGILGGSFFFWWQGVTAFLVSRASPCYQPVFGKLGLIFFLFPSPFSVFSDLTFGPRPVFLFLFQQLLLCKFLCKPLHNLGDSVKEFVNAHGKTSRFSACLPKPRRRQVLCPIPTCLPTGRPEK